MENIGIINKFLKVRKSKKIIEEMGAMLSDDKGQSIKEMVPYVNKPGIIFSFDDSFRVNHWYDYGLGKKQGYKDLFGYYDVKVTFNINAYHHYENQRELTQNEIDMLLELQSNGHEIAHHGFKHKNAVNYSNTNGIENWIEDDISALNIWMGKQEHSKHGDRFKCPVTYAFPGSRYNDETIMSLIPNYFKIARGYLEGDNLIPNSYTGFAPSICIDENVFPNIKLIKPALKYAKVTGKNLVLMAHSILPTNKNWSDFGWGKDSEEAGKYLISPRSIEFIIKEAKKLDLEFYTMSEAAGIATFIDSNLENAIRNKLSITSKWIHIQELQPVKELDLEGMGISNLAGIEYFSNLEKLNILNNKIKDRRLLGKLKNLKELKV